MYINHSIRYLICHLIFSEYRECVTGIRYLDTILSIYHWYLILKYWCMHMSVCVLYVSLVYEKAWNAPLEPLEWNSYFPYKFMCLYASFWEKDLVKDFIVYKRQPQDIHVKTHPSLSYHFSFRGHLIFFPRISSPDWLCRLHRIILVCTIPRPDY